MVRLGCPQYTQPKATLDPAQLKESLKQSQETELGIEGSGELIGDPKPKQTKLPNSLKVFGKTPGLVAVLLELSCSMVPVSTPFPQELLIRLISLSFLIS